MPKFQQRVSLGKDTHMNTTIINEIATDVVEATPAEKQNEIRKAETVRLPVWAWTAFTNEYMTRTGEDVAAHDSSVGAAIEAAIIAQVRAS